MMGFESVEIATAFWLCLAATALCVAYGIRNWNNSGRNETGPSKRGG
ncbi:symporter small accessory protein [Pseudodesulfovibrio tunisiensis]|nr:symporter small accessory protein [Pseudodesulfovibrio tunisiensis]